MLGGRQRPGRGPGRGKTRRHMDLPDSPDLAIPPRVLAALGELAAGSVTLLAGRVDGRGVVVAANPGLRARLGGGGRPPAVPPTPAPPPGSAPALAGLDPPGRRRALGPAVPPARAGG